MAMDQRLVKEAAEWFVRMHDGVPSTATRAQFIEWLLSSPNHLRAFLDVTEAIGSLNVAASDLSKDQLIASASADKEISNVVKLDASAAERANPIPREDEPLRLKRWLLAGIAVLALSAGALAGWLACDHWHTAHFAGLAPNR